MYFTCTTLYLFSISIQPKTVDCLLRGTLALWERQINSFQVYMFFLSFFFLFLFFGLAFMPLFSLQVYLRLAQHQWNVDFSLSWMPGHFWCNNATKTCLKMHAWLLNDTKHMGSVSACCCAILVWIEFSALASALTHNSQVAQFSKLSELLKESIICALSTWRLSSPVIRTC